MSGAPSDPRVPDPVQEKLNELSILQESLQEAKAKAASYYDQLLRLAAEFDNFRKRSEADREKARGRGRDEVLQGLLAFADALDKAQAVVTPQTPAASVREGLSLLHAEMGRLLKDLGVEPIPTERASFDPGLHEAAESVESEEPEGTILGEVQRGYLLNGRVLRPARVRVASPPASGPAPTIS